MSVDLSIPVEAIYAWTDSSAVLGWLKTPPNRLKIFVSHRVTDITTKLAADHWRYISTHSNPADMVSRGVLPSDLLQNQLWWKGLPWLVSALTHWPRRPDID